MANNKHDKFIKEFMGRSVLHKMFVFDSLEKWSNYIRDHQDEVKSQMENGMIAPEAWIELAKEMQDGLDVLLTQAKG